ncbi:MAG: hypothetical protein ACXU8U_06230 [Asticcacaulis sp.]
MTRPPHRRFLVTSILAAAVPAGLSGCAPAGAGRKPRRTLILRMAAASRPVFWEKAQAYAHENGLASSLMPQRPDKPRDFAFLLRGKGLDVIGRNNAYDPLQPDDYVVAFYGSALFAVDDATLNRFADSFLVKVSDRSVSLISDSGPAKS